MTSLPFGVNELLGGIGVPILVSSPDRIGMWANQPFADLFGIEGGPDTIVGQALAPIADRVAPLYRDPEAFRSGIAEVLARGGSSVSQTLELCDGRWISRSCSPVLVAGEPVAFVWRYEDVTEVHRRKQALKRTTSVLEAMMRAHGQGVRTASGSELFSELLASLIEVTESAYGFVGEVLHDGDRPFLRSWAITDIAWDQATREFVDSALQTDGYLEFRKLDTLYGETLRTGEVVISNDPPNDRRAGGLPPGHPPLGAYLGLPVVLNGRLIGMAGVAGRPGGYDEEIVERVQPLLSACATMVEAFAIERERREAEEAVRSALLVAEQANAAKTRLLGRVSHELRTPLNAVLGFEQLLEREVTDDRHRRWVNQIGQAGRHALTQVEELLDLAAAESGHLSVDMASVSVDALSRSVVELVRPLAEERSVSIALEPSGLWAEADAERLRVVLINLTANAVKYNRAGGHVVLSATRVDQGRVQIVVADDGPGIPAGQLEQAFVMFERLDGAGRGVPGAGLGLAIAREYAQAMNGLLSGRPRQGGGVEMMVNLRESAAPSSSGAEPWVLYVEDNELSAELVSEYLSSFEQVVVEVAPTLSDARKVLSTRTPSLVLLDLNLPDGFGGDLAGELLDTHPDLPVVVLTADAFAARDIEQRFPHLVATLVKPLRFEDLSEHVRACIPPANSGAPAGD